MYTYVYTRTDVHAYTLDHQVQECACYTLEQSTPIEHETQDKVTQGA